MGNADPAPLVELRTEGHVAEIVLSRPDRLNAISSAMAKQLASLASQVSQNAGVRAVVVSSSTGRAFCVGADLKERNNFSDAELQAQRPLIRAVFRALLDLPVGTVAAVAGFALGGGFEIALSCDLIVADETAVVGLPEVSVGLVPGGGGTQLLVRRAGPAIAADIVLTGRRVGADEAFRLGLVDRLVTPGNARSEALAIAQQIAKNSPVATRAAKRAMRRGAGQPLEQGLEFEQAAWDQAARSPERREGIAAFVEKRTPTW